MLHEYGFAVQGVAQYALYLLNRLYEPDRTAEELTPLAVLELTDSGLRTRTRVTLPAWAALCRGRGRSRHSQEVGMKNAAQAFGAAVLVIVVLAGGALVAGAQTAPQFKTVSALTSFLFAKGFNCDAPAFGKAPAKSPYSGIPGNSRTNFATCDLAGPSFATDSNDVGGALLSVYPSRGQLKQHASSIQKEACTYAALFFSELNSISGGNWIIYTGLPSPSDLAPALGGTVHSVSCHVKLPKGG